MTDSVVELELGFNNCHMCQSSVLSAFVYKRNVRFLVLEKHPGKVGVFFGDHGGGRTFD